MRPPLLDGLEPVVSVARKARRVALVLENSGDQLADVGFVIDDQNVGCHR